MDIDAVVIGAGQGGLSTSYTLRRLGVEHVVLDADGGPGGAWRHRWPSLLLSTTHAVHDLPGLAFTPRGQQEQASVAVPAYFAEYERRFDLPVLRPVRVGSVTDAGERLRVVTAAGSADGHEWTARAVVSATGTWTRPFWPRYPGQDSFRGRQLHSADYAGAEPFAGRAVVVVGGGSSAVQLLGEISRVATTTWVTRRPPEFREEFTPEDGRAVVAAVADAVERGLPPASVVSRTGLVLTAWTAEARDRGVLQRRPMFDRITPDGVAWSDGSFVPADVILWATGFRPAIEHLAPLRLREPGGGVRMVGTRTAREPRLHLVGYGPSASTIGANRAGQAAGRAVAAALRAPVAAAG